MKLKVIFLFIIIFISYIYTFKYSYCFLIRSWNNMLCGDFFLIYGNKFFRKLFIGSKVYCDLLEFIYFLEYRMELM